MFSPDFDCKFFLSFTTHSHRARKVSDSAAPATDANVNTRANSGTDATRR
jgi:hypothetical protein